MVNHFVLTLTGAAQRLNTAIANSQVGSSQTDPRCVAVTLQPDGANANPVFVGGSNVAVTSANYAFRLEKATATVPPAPLPLELGGRYTRLSDWFVIGTLSEKITVGIVIV